MTEEIKNAAVKLHRLGVEYSDAAIATNGSTRYDDAAECDATYRDDKFPALVGDLFGELTGNEDIELGSQLFAAISTFDPITGGGYSVVRVEKIVTEFFEQLYNAHPMPL